VSAEVLTPSEVVAGIIASDSALSGLQSVDQAEAHLAKVWQGPAAWRPMRMLSSEVGGSARLKLDPDWAVGWTKPDPGIVQRLTGLLELAWKPVGDPRPEDSELGKPSEFVPFLDYG
jgi:hypothetical protein